MSLALALALTIWLPQTPPVPKAMEVVVDTSDAPEAAAWAERAKTLVETWQPKVAALLTPADREVGPPPSKVTLVFKSGMKGVAGTSGNRITISADWIKAHPDDLGMVVHELTHVVQAYPRNQAGWLVEGIADYVRWFVFEPDAPLGPINPARARYQDSYRTTARFLDWAQRAHAPTLVARLNQALHDGKYSDALFEELTHKPLKDLWEEYVSEPGRLKARPRK